MIHGVNIYLKINFRKKFKKFFNTKIKPARALANCVVIHSYLLGDHIPIRSPFSIPKWISPVARRSLLI